ncbi:MAG: hypothetical protein ACKKL4_02655 [Patescibacteria group bacterium]
MLGEIFKANTFLFVVFMAVMIFGLYAFWTGKDDGDAVLQIPGYGSNSLGSQLDNSLYIEDDSSRKSNTDVRGIQSVSGGGGEANQAVFETSPPILEGYVAGYGTKTSGGREYWILLVATPQLKINGYEVDMRDIIGYRKLNTSLWQEGDFVRIYGTLVSETVVRAQAVQ